MHKKPPVAQKFLGLHKTSLLGKAGPADGAGRHALAVQIWDASSMLPSLLREVRGTPIHVLCFSGDGEELALGSNGEVELFSGETAKPRLKIRLAPDREAVGVAFDRRGSLLVAEGPAGAEKWTIHVYDAKSGADAKAIGEALSARDGFAVSAAGDLVATCKKAGAAPQVALYELPTGRLRTRAIGHRGGWPHVAFALSAPMLALSANGGDELWDTRNPREIGFLSGLGFENGQLAFSSDGRLLFVNSYDEGSVHVWDFRLRTELFAIRLPRGLTAHARRYLLAVSPDGKKIACSATDPDGRGGVYLFSGLLPDPAGDRVQPVAKETQAASARD